MLPMLSPRSLTPRALSSLARICWLGTALPCSYSCTTCGFSLISYGREKMRRALERESEGGTAAMAMMGYRGKVLLRQLLALTAGDDGLGDGLVNRVDWGVERGSLADGPERWPTLELLRVLLKLGQTRGRAGVLFVATSRHCRAASLDNAPGDPAFIHYSSFAPSRCPRPWPGSRR